MTSDEPPETRVDLQQQVQDDGDLCIGLKVQEKLPIDAIKCDDLHSESQRKAMNIIPIGALSIFCDVTYCSSLELDCPKNGL